MKNSLWLNRRLIKQQVLFLYITCCYISSIQSQNLVLNPSFEDTISCYDWQNGTFPFSLPALNWNGAIQGSPDYFHPTYCGDNFMPANTIGYQSARTGFAYEGFGVFALTSFNDHEFVGGQLSDSLKQGNQYCLEFYVSAANRCKYFTDGLGVYFSNDTIRDTLQGNYFPYYYPYTPVFESPVGVPITDTLNWVLINGTFTAQGGEKYFAIGNFRDDSFITLDSQANAPVPVAYYYIDDVSVIDCTAGITELPEMEMSLSPNPAGGSLYLTFANYRASDAKISIRDVAGRLVLERCYTTSQKPREINIENLRSGMYFLTFHSAYGRMVNRFVKTGDG